MNELILLFCLSWQHLILVPPQNPPKNQTEEKKTRPEGERKKDPI